jgi:SAM-dependent methyltransferase
MANDELKARQGVMWGSGSFDEVADTITGVHEAIVGALAPAAGEHFLDLACGTGRIAELAAAAGSSVVGIDLAPGLIDVAKRRAADRDLQIDYRVGDCERLDGVADASFDAVASSFGIMFEPDHEAAAAELARVSRPGGRIAIASWTADGSVGAFFRTMAPFQPAPPPSSPLAWGNEEHVRDLLEGQFELGFERRTSTVEWASGQAMWDFMSAKFGPMVTLSATLDEPRRAELAAAVIELSEHSRRGDAIVDDRDYLLVTGTRR